MEKINSNSVIGYLLNLHLDYIKASTCADKELDTSKKEELINKFEKLKSEFLGKVTYIDNIEKKEQGQTFAEIIQMSPNYND